MHIGEPIGVQELIPEEEHPPEPGFRVVPETTPEPEPAGTHGSRSGALTSTDR